MAIDMHEGRRVAPEMRQGIKEHDPAWIEAHKPVPPPNPAQADETPPSADADLTPTAAEPEGGKGKLAEPEEKPDEKELKKKSSKKSVLGRADKKRNARASKK